jgi:hypothetical protein
MATPYDGAVLFDQDEKPAHRVHIDDLDSGQWRADLIAPTLGGPIPMPGHLTRVTLVEGPRTGWAADAQFVGGEDASHKWLEGIGPFGLDPRAV